MYCSGSSSSMATLLQQKNCMKSLSNGGANNGAGIVNTGGTNVNNSGNQTGSTVTAGNTVVSGSITRNRLPHEMVGIPVVPISSNAQGQSTVLFATTGHSASNLINLHQISTSSSNTNQQHSSSTANFYTLTNNHNHHYNNTNSNDQQMYNNHHNHIHQLNNHNLAQHNRLPISNNHHNQTPSGGGGGAVTNAASTVAPVTLSSTSSQDVSYAPHHHHQHHHSSNRLHVNNSAIFQTASTTTTTNNTTSSTSNHQHPHQQQHQQQQHLLVHLHHHNNAGGGDLSNKIVHDNTNSLGNNQNCHDGGGGGDGADQCNNGENSEDNGQMIGEPGAGDIIGNTDAATEEDMDMEPPPEIDIVINNVVCSFSVRCHLNLREIALNGFNVEFRRENGMVTMKLRRPYTTASIWSSGRITCTGATSEEQAKIAARRYARCLEKLGFRVRFQNFRVVNVLGTCSMPWAIKIINFSERFKKDAYYEPELHPGVTYKLKTPKATLKIFSTGSITVTAASVAHVQAAIEHIFPLVYEFRKERTAEQNNAIREKRRAQMFGKVPNDPVEDIMYVSDQEELPDDIIIEKDEGGSDVDEVM